MLIMLLAVSAVAQEATSRAAYVVTKSVANMYRAPDTDSDVVSQAIFATNIEVIETKDGWAKIKTADGYTGWALLSDLRKNAGQPYASKGAVVRVSQLSANIYREPSVTRHAPIATVPWESRLEVISTNAGGTSRWLKVRLPDESEAHVQSGDVSSDFASLSIDQMITVAKRFLGVTYTWGGTSSFGFDCSGFVQMLERQRGVVMPRDASQQVIWSGVMAVERNDLQPGDLLYFGSEGKINHTGMYIGSGEFIHDTTHEVPKVQISKLGEQPWAKLLVAARRVKP